MNEDRIREGIERYLGAGRARAPRRLVFDTTNFTAIDHGDVIVLGDRAYFVWNNEREGRFGIDDQPKFWVKRAVDLSDGRQKVLKLVFRETFRIRIGQLDFDCVRSPAKEARILDLVAGHPGHMTGFSRLDTAGNLVRVIDRIDGERFAESVLDRGRDHEDYFFGHFPDILDDYVVLLEAIRYLHEHREKHGDIRRDHILRDRKNRRCVWIDFDFNYRHRENMFAFDLFGLGNLLAFVVGRGDVTAQRLEEEGARGRHGLRADDMNIVFASRVVNLRKVYGYIPKDLNRILMHFAAGANRFYNDTGELLSDILEVRDRGFSRRVPVKATKGVTE